MSDDPEAHLDELEELDHSAGRRPCLVEHGRSVPAGRVRYVWSTGRIVAIVHGEDIRIVRRWGRTGPDAAANGLRVMRRELRLLLVACRDWVRRRDEWAAFYASSAGYPGGFGAYYYEAPGKNGKHVADVPHRRRAGGPRILVGREEVVPVATPLTVARGVVVVAHLWRRGENYGPKAGSLVGQRYRIGADLFLDAQRDDSRAWRKRSSVFLEPDEEAFVEALCGLRRG